MLVARGTRSSHAYLEEALWLAQGQVPRWQDQRARPGARALRDAHRHLGGDSAQAAERHHRRGRRRNPEPTIRELLSRRADPGAGRRHHARRRRGRQRLREDPKRRQVRAARRRHPRGARGLGARRHQLERSGAAGGAVARQGPAAHDRGARGARGHARALHVPELPASARASSTIASSRSTRPKTAPTSSTSSSGTAPRATTRTSATHNARRVFRGGVTEGGAPFTKDACYCKGSSQLRLHSRRHPEQARRARAFLVRRQGRPRGHPGALRARGRRRGAPADARSADVPRYERARDLDGVFELLFRMGGQRGRRPLRQAISECGGIAHARVDQRRLTCAWNRRLSLFDVRAHPRSRRRSARAAPAARARTPGLARGSSRAPPARCA